MTRLPTIFLAFVLLVAAAAPATAWQSEVHTGLAQLNPALWAVPGVAGSRNWILTAEEIPDACHGRHAMTTPDGWRERVYWDLVCGSTEPDAGKGFLNLRNPSHQRHSAERSVQAWDAAFGQFQQTGPERDARAARRLGHSLHYLQDHADPTKILVHDQDMLRRGVGYHVQGLLRYRRDTGQNHPALRRRLDQWRAEVASLREPGEILRWAGWHQQKLADAIGGVLARDASWPMHGGGEQLDNLLLHTIAVSVAAQERMVQRYLQRIEGAPPTEPVWTPPVEETWPDFDSEAFERPEYEMEATPRPQVGEPPRR